MAVKWNDVEQATFDPSSIVFTVIADGNEIIAVDADGWKLASLEIGGDDSQSGAEIMLLAQKVRAKFDEVFG